MKQSPILFLTLFSIVVTSLISSMDAQSVGNVNSIMTINNFEKGGDGGGPSECDGHYHSNDTPIVALSTKWYNHGQRCFKLINIYYNGKSVQAQVVDECDSNNGCGDNIVDASKAIWESLQVSKSEWGKPPLLGLTHNPHGQRYVCVL